ncbi:unnamed protein product [Peronospora belbahrii]|uniref:Myb-like domain-containing protein n=1 Tax=Peronospora belbahrii TaxID=622444 RepID=A0ABN8D914_9STRA|nr:unnamed protein product [Peronospora belbahrii]
MQLDSDTGYSCDEGLRNRSKWRREEHGRFMQALELYGARQTGDEWKHITEFVGSRTMMEVRLHGRQYLQRLVQQLPLTPMVTPPNGYFPRADSQNDPNRLNYQVHWGVDRQKIRSDKVHFRSQSLHPLEQQNHSVITAIHGNGRRPKAWTFQEEKAFETALAGCAGSKSYPWANIAAIIPGRTAKDVRSRYDEMVEEVASIEAYETPVTDSSTSSRIQRDSVVVRQQGRSSLSRRAIPPPPIEVPPIRGGKDGAVGIFSSGTSTRSSRGFSSGIAMLSPTFLDMLANEADSEEKSPLPALSPPFSGLTNLPSPLFSPTLLSAGLRGKTLMNADSCGDVVKMKDMNTGPATASSGSKDPRHSTTPRILNDFFAGDFRFDDPFGTTPIQRRKSPRLRKLATVKQESSTIKIENGAGKLDVKMTDASAA